MSTSARAIAIVGFVIATGLVVTLHILRTDLRPAANRLSEYANGPYGWLMTTSFVALGCGLLSLGVLIRSERSREWRSLANPVLALVAGAATILSGFFPIGPSTTDGSIHSPASAVAVVAVVALAMSHSILAASGGPGWKAERTGAALALIAFVLAALSPLIHHSRWTGFGQRALWIVVTVWLLRTAWIGVPQSSPSDASSGTDHGEEMAARGGHTSDWAGSGG